MVAKPKPKPKTKGYPIELRTIGDHIRKKRMDERLSQAQLAKKLNIRTHRIWLWERDMTVPVISICPTVIEFLGYDPLFDDSGTLQAQVENYRRKHGLSYQQLANSISIGLTPLSQFAKHGIGSEKTIEMIQKFLEEPSE